jgi:ABC-2 type transport system permease protein
VDELADAGGLYGRLVAARIRSQLQYPASFALQATGMFLLSFLDFIEILIIFANVPALASWTMPEVTLLYGISSLTFALTDLAIGHLDLLPQLVRDGTFDLMLVRPRGAMYQVLTADFQIRRLGKILQSAVVLALALAIAGIHWTPDRVAVLVIALPAAVLIFIGIWATAICVVFWTVDGGEFANAFSYGGSYLAHYPVDIFDPWLRRLLAFAVPTAFVAYFPALYLLGKPDPLGLPAILQVASPAVGIVACLVAAGTWAVATRRYQSAGG